MYYKSIMIRKAVTEALQNKNSVMFITSLVFMCGILSFFYGHAIVYAATLTILGILLLIKNYVSTKYIIFWILMFYFGFFISLLKIHTTDELLPLAPCDCIMTGQIISIPNSNVKEKSKFFVNVNKIDNKNINAKTLVTVNDVDGNFQDLTIGNTYEFKGKLRAPFSAGNPSQFDYGKYLRNFDTFTVYYADKNDVHKIESELTLKWKFLQNLNKIRNKIISTHSEFLKSPYLEILGGIVFGDDAVAPPDYIKASFINSGLLHILAASGMNVAFIYGFWFFFMRRLKVPFKISVISGMFVIILYTFMTGLGPSLIRAALMLLIILIGKLIDRDTHSVSLLALVALLMLIYNPAYINDVGFQLSFLVTFGLLTTGNIIFEKLKEINVPDWISGTLLIPVIAQIWVAPIQMFYFNTFSLYSIFANILSVPFLSVVSFGGFLSSIAALFMPYTKFVCMPLDFILNYILKIIVYISDFFAKLPNSIVETTHPTIFQLFIYYCVVLLITISIKIFSDKETMKKLLYTSLVLITLLIISTINIPNNNLEIITFDVQNADCFLIKTPQNKYFIIDTGRSGYKKGQSQAKAILIKYMKDRGIKNIEGMIITHFDNDHSGGAYDIMNTLNVENVYINSFTDTSPSAEFVYKGIQENKVNARIPENNTTIYTEPDFKLKTYYAAIPVRKFKYEGQHENENSIVTLLQYKNFDMLFMGDAGITAFNKIEKDIPTNVEVLKVGHHGGPNVVDKRMLDKLNTKISIVSTGLNNFGHPNKSTIDILRNTEIYRTDRHNSIKITTDGDLYTILTYDKSKRKYTKSRILQTIH